jgi:hypothetical protein
MQVLLVYTLLVLALLTALVYIASMMFIYRKDASDLIHTYLSQFDEELEMITGQQSPPSLTEVRYAIFSPT